MLHTMPRIPLLLAAVVSVGSAYVYTCNEIRSLIAESALVKGTQACMVLPDFLKFPYNDEPYTEYLWNTYLYDSASGKRHELSGLLEEESHCVSGHGPWMVLSDNPLEFKCTSAQHQYAEIIILFTSQDTNVTAGKTESSTATYGPGTYTFVAPEGSLIVDKVSIEDGREATLKWYSGIGDSEYEEMFAMMPEHFIAGTSTIIIGPVATLIIEDDVTIQLTLTSFQDQYLATVDPGFEFSVMTTGRANDLQSSRPTITVSFNYGTDQDVHTPVTYTGTAKFDDKVHTEFGVGGYVEQRHKVVYFQTGDIVGKTTASRVDITYTGPPLTTRQIGRSSEVIYLRVTSEPAAEPVVSTSSAPDSTYEPVNTVGTDTKPTRRTPPPTSTTTAGPTSPRSTTAKATMTSTRPIQTTSGAFAASLIAPLLMSVYFL